MPSGSNLRYSGEGARETHQEIAGPPVHSQREQDTRDAIKHRFLG